MIFQHTWQKTIEGRKTQTRRIVKQGEDLRSIGTAKWIENHNKPWKSAKNCFYTSYATGHTYAVQSGQGKPAVARIRLLDIAKEDVRGITDDDVRAEGFESALDFIKTWIEMHDKGIMLSRLDYPIRDMQAGDWYMHCTERGDKWHKDNASEDFIWGKIAARPDERYQSWVLMFELVRPVEQPVSLDWKFLEEEFGRHG